MFLRAWLLIAWVCAAGCQGPSPSQPQDSQAASPTETPEYAQSQEFGDFSFSIPQGWTVVAPDRAKTKAMLLLDGTNWQDAKAMIKVDVGAPAAPTAGQIVEGFAKSAGGNVLPDAVDLDGIPAASAETASTELATPRRMTVAYHNDRAYLLMAAATEGVDVDVALEKICESWKWTESRTE